MVPLLKNIVSLSIHSLLIRRLFRPIARLGASVSALLSRLMTDGLKLTLLTALEGGCNLK